jgi:hypothetical protein
LTFHPARWSGIPVNCVGGWFIVANMTGPAERVVAFHNHSRHGGAVYQKSKNAVIWKRPSGSGRPAVASQPPMLSGSNCTRRPTTWQSSPQPGAVGRGEHWSMTTLRARLVKIGAKLGTIDCRQPTCVPLEALGVVRLPIGPSSTGSQAAARLFVDPIVAECLKRPFGCIRDGRVDMENVGYLVRAIWVNHYGLQQAA